MGAQNSLIGRLGSSCRCFRGIDFLCILVCCTEKDMISTCPVLQYREQYTWHNYRTNTISLVVDGKNGGCAARFFQGLLAMAPPI